MHGPTGKKTTMYTSVSGSTQHVKVGGFAALYLAAAYVVAMPYFLFVVRISDVSDPVEKVSLVVSNHDSMRAMYLITYVVFGIVLAMLVMAIHARLKGGAPALSQAAAVVGCLWAAMLVASGLTFNAAITASVGLHATSPAQAVSVWQAMEPVANGLGSSDGELLGGLWVLLVSVAALRSAALPKALNWSGVVVGAAGVVSVLPGLAAGAYVFGLLQIVWFVWLGIVLLRTASRRSARATAAASVEGRLPGAAA